MEHPRYTLGVDARNPAGPFIIREYGMTDGHMAQRPHSSYPKMKEALLALSRLTNEEIIIAVSSASVDESALFAIY